MAWETLCKVLNLQPRSPVLPSRVTCPGCGSADAEILPDILNGSAWYWCQACRKSLDLLSLAAWTWKVAPEEAFAQLVAKGVLPRENAAELQDFSAQDIRRRLLLVLDEQARKGLYHHNSSYDTGIVNKLQLSLDVTDKRLLEDVSQFYGVVDRKAVEFAARSTFVSENIREQARTNFHRKGSPMFRGGRWHEVIVLPCYDLPGRHCGVVCLGRNARPGDVVPFAAYGTELGLSFHRNIWESLESWDNTVVAVETITRSIRRQTRHLEGSRLPLPLVIWHDRLRFNMRLFTRHGWDTFRRQRIVLWTTIATAKVVRQVVYANADVTYRPEDNELEYQHQMERAIREARPWQEVVDRLLREMADPELAVVAELFETEHDIDRLLEACSPQTKQRLEQRLSSGKKRLAWVDDSGIFANDNGVFVAEMSRDVARNVLLSSLLPEITRATYDAVSEDVFYEGVVRCQDGEVIPFGVFKTEFEKDAFSWLTMLMIKNGKPMPRRDRPFKLLHQVIMALSNPSTGTGLVTPGWQADRGCYMFPRFTLEPDGQVVEHKLSAQLSHPTAKLLPPQPLSPADVAGPIGEASSALYWACLAGLISKVVAPVFGRRVEGLAVAGDSAQVVMEVICAACGCYGPEHGDKRKSANWPIYAHTWNRTYLVQAGQMDEYDDWAIFEALPSGARASRAIGELNTIESDDPDVMPPPSRDMGVIGQVFVNYLHDLTLRHFELDNGDERKESWYEDILEDLARFVERQGGSAEKVRQALKYVDVASPAGRPLGIVEELVLRIQKGEVALVHAGFTKRVRRPYLEVQDDGNVLMTRAALRHLATFYAPGASAADKLRQILKDAGAIVAETDAGLLLDGDWWKMALRKTRSTRKLKVVG